MRRAAIFLAAMSLAACSVPVVVRNPATGETATCSGGWRDQGPWSQREACIADHIAQGWVVTQED